VSPALQPVRLGNHELLIRLASGGAANVFLVRDLAAPPPGRLLALKILQPSLAANDDFLNMFFTEARIAAQLQHPNVVAIAGFGQVEGIHCLAMEYVFGPSLSQVLRASARARRPLTVGVLLRIAAAVCDALHYAHELRDKVGQPLGLVHRDVTPQNILIGYNGVPKLTDFGIAKATNRGWETQAGIVKGKFSYMSPEQALGKKVDRRSDIFGTGIVLWEALTGRDLFKGSTPMEVLTAIREQKIEPPSKVVAGLTPIVDGIVMKALRRSPNQRYQTAAAMREDIEELIRRAGVSIDAQTISREFATIYGDDIGKRMIVLRQAMAGKPDLEQMASVLGGSVLNQKLLPVIPGGITDPDPLGLFSEDALAQRELEAVEAFLPARPERSFVSARAVESEFEIYEELGPEDIEPAAPEVEPEPLPVEARAVDIPEVPDERALSGWDDSTAMAVPEDELLAMLSEEDATVGFLPPELAERFGRELEKALGKGPPATRVFEEEATIGTPDAPGLTDLRILSDEQSEVWAARSPTGAPVPSAAFHARVPAARTEPAARPSPRTGPRPVPRAPSLAMDREEAERLVSGRPIPRAPSLDMDVDHDRTPVPVFDYDPVAEPALPSRTTRAASPVEPAVDPSYDAVPFAPTMRAIGALDLPDEPVAASMPGLPVMSMDPPRVDAARAPSVLDVQVPRDEPRPSSSAAFSPLTPESLMALARDGSAIAGPEPRGHTTAPPPGPPAPLTIAPPPPLSVPPRLGPKARIQLTPAMLAVMMAVLLVAGLALGLVLAPRLLGR
jgi:serine/threonine protein kinase